MNIEKNIKVPSLIMSLILFSNTNIGLKLFCSIKCKTLNYLTLKMGVAITFSLQLGNHKPQCSYFEILFKVNNCT